MDPAVQRIVLIDGPAVLGWETWRGLEEQFGLGVLRHALDLAVADGVIVEQPTEPLAHMLLAVVDEAALYIANAPNKRRARTETVARSTSSSTAFVPPDAPLGWRALQATFSVGPDSS